LSADERALGQLLFGPDRVARLLLVEHKDAVSAVLLALAAQWSGEDAPRPQESGPWSGAERGVPKKRIKAADTRSGSL
jgi:hypothetical protein